MMRRKWWVLLLVGLALVVLPTGTPEDLVTTFLFVEWLGWRGYLVLALVTLALVLALLPRRYWRKLL